MLDGSGAGLGHGFGDGGVHFGIAGTGRKIRFDDGEFFGFFFDEIVAIAFGELVDGFFALLDESLQQLDGLGLVELAEFFVFFVGDGGLDAANDAEAEFVLGAHCVGEIFLDFFGESHAHEYSRKRKEFNTEITEGTEKSQTE